MISTASRLSYAQGYIELGMYAAARKELDALPEAERLTEPSLGLRIRICMETKNWKIMAAVAETLTSRFPKAADGWLHWAYALRELEEIERAKQIALQGLALHPDNAILWFNLACYCSLRGEVRSATDHLKKAVLLDSSFAAEAESDPDLAAYRRHRDAAK